MKEADLFSPNKEKIKSINTNQKQIPTRAKHDLITLKSFPQSIAGSKSFRQQSYYFTTKNSKEKNKKIKSNENTSFDEKSKVKENQKMKNKNIIINIKNPKNYNNPKGKINFFYNTKNSPNCNNNNEIKTITINEPKFEEEQKLLGINSITNSINQYFSESANNSIYIHNKKNLIKNQNNKLLLGLTNCIEGCKGIMKGYHTSQNTANNSIIQSIEKFTKPNKENKRFIKSNLINSNESSISKYTNKPNDNKKELHLHKDYKKYINKISQTTKNSRKNSRDKFPGNKKSKLISLGKREIFLNSIRELNLNDSSHKPKNKMISAQVTIDKKKKETKNNNCITKNSLLRKFNQEKIKLQSTIVRGNKNFSISKLNSKNTKSNSDFSRRQNLKGENLLIKVNKNNRKINDICSNNNNFKNEILYHRNYKYKNIIKKGKLNLNEDTIDIFRKKNQKLFPTSYFFNKVEHEINKKIKTAGNSPRHDKAKDKQSNMMKIKNKEKKSYTNIKQRILSKNIIDKFSLGKIPNLKSACITRKNSKNKFFKEHTNIKSEKKIYMKKENFDDSYPQNSLRSLNSLVNYNLIDNNCNSKYNTNGKNSKKILNSIINIGIDFKNQKNKQMNKIKFNGQNNRLIHTKNNSSNNSKLKINNKNINLKSSQNNKIKPNHALDKGKVNITDNIHQIKIKKEIKDNYIIREKSLGNLKHKKNNKKIKISENETEENTKKILVNKGKNLNDQNPKNKNIINKSKIEQILLQKEKIKTKIINIMPSINNDEDLLNTNRNNQENTSRSKIAKKSARNRNIEQNPIFNSNNTNTSLLSTMKDSNYYSQESENLSKYIKYYYKSHLSYPPTDISFYKFGRMIGRGAFGKVNIGLNILTGRIVAIKSFNKQNLTNEKAKKKILYETNLMRSLYHPSVTKILETFETDKYMLIIMEYISGGNLQNFVRKRRKLCEKTARILYRQLIQGIKYIHSKGIVHRDIKLENILLDLNNIVKICDFGVGKLTEKGQKLSDQCGTPVYMAPEIIKGEGYEGFPVDIWSSGVALYIMLSGNIPFNRDKIHDLQSAILNCPYKKIEGISDNANDLLENILEKDPNLRFTPDQILEHPWMNEKSVNDDDCSDYNYNLEIKNVNKYHLFTNAESILLAKTHIDYRKAPKKDLAENFTIKNLYTIEDKKNNNVDTKSIILAPYNSMLTETEEEEEEDEENNKTIKRKEKAKKKLENIEDIKNKAINYYSQSTNPLDILDNFNLELEVKNGIIKFHGKVKEFNMNFELNNNEEIDNGILINSKDELVLNDNGSDNKNEKLENYIKNNNYSNIKETNKNKKTNHRPTSPYKQPPINPYFVKMVSELGYDENYVIKSLEQNELNHATTIYYLFSNYENIK